MKGLKLSIPTETPKTREELLVLTNKCVDVLKNINRLLDETYLRCAKQLEKENEAKL